MKITSFGVAVLDDGKDDLLSRWVEKDGRLDHDGSLPIYYLPHIKPGDVVVDAGAAIGDHTIAYMHAAGDPKNVHAFECNPEMIECLRFNCPGCNIYPAALSDKNGKAWMVNHLDNPGSNYLKDDSDNAYEVATIRLDEIGLRKLDFIKLDIEGYECKAMIGALETINRCKPKIIMEINPWMLKRAGNSKDELFMLMSLIGYRGQQIMGEEPNPQDPTSRGEYLFVPA